MMVVGLVLGDQRDGNDDTSGGVRSWRSTLAAIEGRYADAERLIAAVEEIGRRTDDPQGPALRRDPVEGAPL